MVKVAVPSILLAGTLLLTAFAFAAPVAKAARSGAAPQAARSPHTPPASTGNGPRHSSSARSLSATEAALQAETKRANELLGNLAKTYRYLDGTTVRMGVTPENKEAVAYYEDKEIVVSPTHTVLLDEILAHEVWHVIDWRDNGRIDWGEDLPPRNSSDYLLK